MEEKLNRFKKGFTLVELLIVMSIIGILAAVGLGTYSTAQMRGRDATRKSDLRQIAHSLELYYSDYGVYPNSITFGSAFTDGKTVYFKEVPEDPVVNTNYVYRIVPSSATQKFQLYAYLENDKDQELISGLTQSCGTGKICNFAVTSANTDPTED